MPSREYPCDLPGVRVLRLDWSDRSPAADALWQAWFDLDNALLRQTLGPTCNVQDAEAVRAAQPASESDHRHYLVLDGDRPVATGRFSRQPVDTPATTVLQVTVLPEERHRGIGRALHEAMLVDAREVGCTEVIVTTEQRGAGDAPRDPARDAACARAAGYAPYQELVCSVLPIPLPRAFHEARERQERDGTPGYAVQTHVGVPPREWLDDLATLRERLSTDAPPGDRPAVAERWHAARVAQDYARWVDAGETIVLAVARDEASGRLVGYTDTSWMPSMPHVAHQGGTLVHADHRGHGLGRALKVAAISEIVARCPQAQLQRTTNAAENAPMRRTNAELGYVEDFLLTYWRQDLPPAPDVQAV